MPKPAQNSEWQWQMGSDGALERYAAPFNTVTDEDVKLAAQAEQEIIQAKNDIELGFAKMAFLLDEIEKRKLYRARGYERFRDWVESPEIEISHRVAQDLIRIRREVVPLLGDGAEGAIGQIGISKVRAMLPLLAEENGEQAFLDLTNQLLESDTKLTWNDVRAEVKRIRGQEQPVEQGYPAVFKAKVRQGEKATRVEITGMDGVDVATLGVLTIPNAWWPRWTARFGDFIEHESP